MKETDPDVQPYFNFREIVQDGIISKGDKIVVPPSLRSDYLIQIHQGHPGVEATKNKVRDVFYWPSLSRDVEKLVTQCHQQKEPLNIHEVI